MTHQSESPEKVAAEDVCELLRNPRRRYVVSFLCKRNQQIELLTLAEYVAACDLNVPPAKVRYDDKKRIKNALYQHHLPKMKEYGAIEYDEQRKIVKPTPFTKELGRCLCRLEHPEKSWYRYYLAVVGVEMVMLLFLWLDVHPLTLLPSVVWATIFVLLLFVVAIIHAWSNHHERKRSLT